MGDARGRRRQRTRLLAALRGLPGVSLDSTARVHSFGVLGVIGTPQDQVGEMLAAAVEVEEGVRRYVSTRVAVVSTGAELRDRRVHDTNLEAIAEVLGAAGYEVSSGGAVVDDERTIAGRVARLVSDGFGCVITTGGVGAEDKDKTIEALQLLDPRLPTAVLARYTPGHGRHVKDAVRVAATQIGWTTVIALPGPTPRCGWRCRRSSRHSDVSSHHRRWRRRSPSCSGANYGRTARTGDHGKP